MKQIDYKQAVGLDDQKQIDQAVLICYYHYKETGESQFEPKGIQALFSDFGFYTINVSRVKKALIEKRKMRTIKGMQSTLEFIPTVLQKLESQYDVLNLNIHVILFAADPACMDALNDYAKDKFHELNDANRRRTVTLPERFKK